MFMLGTIALSYHLYDKVDLFPQDSLVLKDDIVPNEQRKPRAWMKNSGVNYFFFFPNVREEDNKSGFPNISITTTLETF